MKRLLRIAIILMAPGVVAQSQDVKLWTDVDRQYLLDNLIRSRNELLNETAGLTTEQRIFKESPDRWSINEIVEHIAIWELLMTHQISKQLNAGPQPTLANNAVPDSLNFNFIMEGKKHYSTDYTKPFTYTLPMGLNDLESNLAWLLKMRNESIEFISKTNDDLRMYYTPGSRSNTHQVYITLFGHTDRHIRQIRTIKQHVMYPRAK